MRAISGIKKTRLTGVIYRRLRIEGDGIIKKLLFYGAAVLAVVIIVWKGESLVTLFGSDSALPGNGRRFESALVKVITRSVEITADDRVFEAVGTGRARLSVDIYPSVAEAVVDVFFKAQQKVSRGDLLVQLDDREEQLAVRLAEVRIRDARSLLNRYEQAVKEGAVPESEVDSARADYEGMAVALEQARLALEERQIRAPFDGVVGIPRVDPGDRVRTDTLITGLDAREVLFVDFEVPEALAAALRDAQSNGEPITATTPAHPGRIFSGIISAQESRVDAMRRTVTARASIDNGEDLLRPGMSFTVRWKIPGGQYPTVPEISLQWGRDGSYVWLVRNGKAVRVAARVISRKGGFVLLNGDLTEADEVVVEGLQRLVLGINVTVLGNAQAGSVKP